MSFFYSLQDANFDGELENIETALVIEYIISLDILSKGGVSYPPQSAFCLETQHFPDSPNHKNFPSAELSPGDEYEQIATFQFTAE